ncbi:MAG: tetratricopeptide repeat protein [Methylococcales bacterium]|nr:tetratricopeptide repeat protein [Methylococcales bacterium]
MLIKRLFLLCSVPVIITGCAELIDTQPPAPVYGNGTPLYNNKPLPQEKPKPVAEQTKPVVTDGGAVTTAPLKGSESVTTPKALKPEPLPQGQAMLTPAQEQELAALQQQQHPVLPEAELEPEPKSKPVKKPVPEVVPEPEAVAPPQPAAAPFQPLDTFTSLSPVVGSLVLAANEDHQKGNVDSATTTLERATRIEPRNAALYYKLALLKLKSKPSQAEDLAKKSAQLAANDPALKKHSWLLVAKAREMQKDLKGAEEARNKASKF